VDILPQHQRRIGVPRVVEADVVEVGLKEQALIPGNRTRPWSTMTYSQRLGRALSS